MADSYSKFDGAIANAAIDYDVSPWGAGGLDCRFDLLEDLWAIALAAGRLPNGEIDQKSGAFAKALDCWSAVELRRAGFPADDVWPRAEMPRVLTRELALLTETATDLEHPSKSAAYREKLSLWLSTHSRSSKVAPTEARVLGGVYRKQADVLIADWASGIELMISTKSMLGSYGKNLRNRFEESFGDAINLKQRFPLGVFGFMFAVDSKVPPSDFVFLTQMLHKLVDNAGYDAACLLVVDLDTDRLDASGKLKIPDELSAHVFFDRLVQCVVDRTPASRHQKVRQFRGLEFDDSDA